MMRTFLRHFFWRFFILLSAMLYAAVHFANGQTDENIVILNHADSLVGREINGEKARELHGNVQFTHGKVVILCQKAIQYLSSNKVEMDGVVTVRDDSMTLVAQRGLYDGNSKSAEAFERVRLDDPTTTLNALYGKYYSTEKRAYFRDKVSVQDSASTLTCDELTYYREEQKLFGDGHVKIINPQNSLTLIGGHFENYRKRRFNILTQQPKAIQVDTSSKGEIDTFVVASRIMESFEDSVQQLIATDSVTLTRGSLAAEGGRAIFYTKLDSIVLEKKPFVWYSAAQRETTQVSGDSMFVKLKKRKIESLLVRGNAIAISQADSLDRRRYDQMTGQEMTIRFDESKIERIDVEGTAAMVYYLYDGGKRDGLNKTTGDHVTITFVESKIDEIKVVGGIEGQYVPERILRGHERDYDLPGFNWREHRPRMQHIATIKQQKQSQKE